jgi:hypothetical protein
MIPEPAVLCPATSPSASTARMTAAAVYVVCSTGQLTSAFSPALDASAYTQPVQ